MAMTESRQRQSLSGPDSARERVEAAMIELVVTYGYSETSVEMVLDQAGVSRSEFERHYTGKEDCALQTFDDYAKRFKRQVGDAYTSNDNWRDGLRAAAYAAARWIRDKPKATRYGVLDFLNASEMAQVRREAIFQDFVAMIDAGRYELEDPESVPRSAAVTAIGAIAEMLTQRLQSGEPARPYEMVPQLMYIAVRPYLGHAEALEELSIPPPPEPNDHG
jgi:AcrR family transcriptional regulator